MFSDMYSLVSVLVYVSVVSEKCFVSHFIVHVRDGSEKYFPSGRTYWRSSALKDGYFMVLKATISKSEMLPN